MAAAGLPAWCRFNLLSEILSVQAVVGRGGGGRGVEFQSLERDSVCSSYPAGGVIPVLPGGFNLLSEILSVQACSWLFALSDRYIVSIS